MAYDTGIIPAKHSNKMILITSNKNKRGSHRENTLIDVLYPIKSVLILIKVQLYLSIIKSSLHFIMSELFRVAQKGEKLKIF